MFGSRKRLFPFVNPQENICKEKIKCYCPAILREKLEALKSYSEPQESLPAQNQCTNVVQHTESDYLNMETEPSYPDGCNNNVPSEYDRNIQNPKHQTCRQCLAGQGGHFMHISTDGNNNT